MRRGFGLALAAAVTLTLGIGSLALAAGPVAQATPSPLGEGVDVAEFYFDARVDLETVADAALGEGVRPADWTGNLDNTSPSFVADLWYDSELLADSVFGPSQRPADWQAATVASPEALARTVRRNVELTADEVFGLGTRPDNWRSAPVLLLCDRTLLNTLSLLELFYRFERQTPDSALNFCSALQSEIDEKLNDLIFSEPDNNGNVSDPIALLSAARGDLERLADELLGLNTRPEGYTINRDTQSPTFIGDLFLDLNSLANDQLGESVRPPGWIGVVSSSPGSSYYNIRRDLELLASATLPADRDTLRPNGWQGTNPIEQCRPAVTYLAFLVQQGYNVTFPELDPLAADFCQQLEESLNAVVENPPVLDETIVEARLTGSSDYAFAYLDPSALAYMGVMPGGTAFRSVYRNYGDSHMMFVVGEGFAVWVDSRFTTVEETVYNSLPTTDGAEPIAFCDALWCNGPGPTPTPTGSTPLELVLFGSTPQATPDQSQLEATKQLVPWDYVRVTYIQDNPSTRTAWVTLELCSSPAATATACEPVTYVFDNASGVEKPVISQQNGLNVYEFRYGYTTNVLLQSVTLYANDLWVSEPNIR